jgi:hypothetical protein
MRTTAIALALLGSALTAQQGSYSYYGSGCTGTGFSCRENNPLGGTLVPGANTNEFALDVPVSTDAVTVLGFELWTRSTTGGPASLPVALYLEGAGGHPSPAPLATATMAVDTTAGWHTALFAPPVVVPRGKRIFLGFGGTASVNHPFLTTGTESAYYWRTDSAAIWNRPSTRQRWAWKVLCASGTASEPLIATSDVPTFGKPLRIELRAAKAATSAALLTGALQLGFELKSLGAPNCWLLTSSELVLPTITDAAGRAALTLLLPADIGLVGKRFYQQWAVTDLAANAFGVVFTAGGNALVGS